MNIIEFFNPQDPSHLKAFRNMGQTGKWEEGFIPDGILFPPGWQFVLMSKLVDAYLLEKLGPEPIVIKVQGIDARLVMNK